MEEYLLTARSVTHAQRMMQVLAQNGYHAAMGRSPVGLSGSGCDGSGLRLCAAYAGPPGGGGGSGIAARSWICTPARVSAAGAWI